MSVIASEIIIIVLLVPADMTALKLLETFKQSRKHLALVPDEFGTVQGLVTLVDVFEKIVGDNPVIRPAATNARRAARRWLVARRCFTGVGRVEATARRATTARRRPGGAECGAWPRSHHLPPQSAAGRGAS